MYNFKLPFKHGAKIQESNQETEKSCTLVNRLVSKSYYSWDATRRKSYKTH